MVNNRKSNGNLVQFQRKKSSTCITSEASQIVSNQEYDMRRNEINQINNNHFTITIALKMLIPHAYTVRI